MPQVKRYEDFKSLQGTIKIAKLVDGVRTTTRELGNQTSVVLGVETSKLEIQGTKGRVRSAVKTVDTEKKVSLEIKCNEMVPEDMALAFGAEYVEVGIGTVTDEVLPTVKAGDSIKLAGNAVTNLVITDANGTALLAVDYTLKAQYGDVKFGDMTGLTMPLTASYETGATGNAAIFSLPNNTEFYVFFDGYDQFGGEDVAFELYRYSPSVNNSLEFINDETGELSLAGSVLLNDDTAEDPLLGAFGRIITVLKGA